MTTPATPAAPAPENATQRPTRSTRELLNKLIFREEPGRTLYVAHAPRGRLVLVVPSLLTSRSLSSNGAYSMGTVRTAHAAGWILWGEYIPAEDLPAFDYDPRPGKTGGGYTIAITDAGKTAIGKAT